MQVGYLSLAVMIGLHVLSVADGCGKSCEAELDALEAEMPCNGCAACPCFPPINMTMMPPMMPMVPMMPPPMMIPAMMAAMAMKAMMFKKAMKMLKKQKMMEKKMAKKAYKKGKKVIMARMMAGQMPQPADFLNGRDEYSYFEFPRLPGIPELPPLIPRPGDLEMADYKALFKMMNKKKGKGKKG